MNLLDTAVKQEDHVIPITPISVDENEKKGTEDQEHHSVERTSCLNFCGIFDGFFSFL